MAPGHDATRYPGLLAVPRPARAAGGAIRWVCADAPREQGESPRFQDLLSAAKIIGGMQPGENVAGTGQVHLPGWLIGS